MQSSELIEKLFNAPFLRTLPDTIFFDLVNGVIAPTDQMGLLYTKEEIKEVLRVLTVYINDFPDNQVKACREEFFMKYFPERYGLQRQRVKYERKPKSGYIYLLSQNDGTYKIGRSQNVKNRLKSIKYNTPSAILEYRFPADDMTEAEREIHQNFQAKALGSEWFDLSHEDVLNIKAIAKYENGEFKRKGWDND